MSAKADSISMSTDQFLRLASILANSAWVRYYLFSHHRRMVLEIANLCNEDLSGLRAELKEKGFREEPDLTAGGVALVRFSVARSDPEYLPPARLDAHRAIG